MIKNICPYCGSINTETTLGDYGNPFDRRAEKTVCLDCGRTIAGTESKKDAAIPDLSVELSMMNELEEAENKQTVVIIEMTAQAAGITRTAKVKLPYEDGNYPLSDYDYPLSRFSRIIIDCDRLDLDGEISKLTNNVLETEKHFIAYDQNKYGWDETVKIKIYKEIE